MDAVQEEIEPPSGRLRLFRLEYGARFEYGERAHETHGVLRDRRGQGFRSRIAR